MTAERTTSGNYSATRLPAATRAPPSNTSSQQIPATLRSALASGSTYDAQPSSHQTSSTNPYAVSTGTAYDTSAAGPRSSFGMRAATSHDSSARGPSSSYGMRTIGSPGSMPSSVSSSQGMRIAPPQSSSQRLPAAAPTPAETTLSDSEYQQLSSIIEMHIGLHMPATKRTMLQARVLRRMHRLGLSTFGEYCALLDQDLTTSDPRRSGELVAFLDLATTNKTSFFREQEHFDLLADRLLPTLLARADKRGQTPIRVWSAACSTGEEPYSLAMVLAETLERHSPLVDFQVFGSDVCTEVLRRAAAATYSLSDIEPLPEARRRRWLLRSRDRNAGLVRIEPGLRATVRFAQLNFVDDRWSLAQSVDIVFLRNALIYFDRDRQREIVSRICGNLADDGYLVVGLSESLHNLSLPLVHLGRSVYQKSNPTHSVIR